MISWFLPLALVISAIFSTAILVIFIYSVIIYFNVEKTLYKIKQEGQEKNE